jgi:hypothetical protein
MKSTGRLALGVWAATLLMGTGLAQDRGKDPLKDTGCDLKTLEKGFWCEKCDKLLEKSDLKEGKHGAEGCSEKHKDVEVCVKDLYAAKCHPDKPLPKDGK